MNSVGPRRSLFSLAWTRLLLIVMGVGALLLAAAPVALAECPLTDPLCLAESQPQLQAPPPPSLPPVPDDPKKVVDDAVNKAKGEVDKVVGQVTDAVDDLLNPGGKDPGPGGGGGGSGPGNTPGSGPGDAGRSGNPEGRLPGSDFPGSRLTTPVNTPSRPAAFRDQPGVFGRIGDAAVEAAKRLGFPLALAAIVVAFAMVQNYLDRRDPRLALAPVRPEVMRFE